MTRDMDIVVELATGDARRVVELFSPEYYVSDEAVRSAISARSLVETALPRDLSEYWRKRGITERFYRPEFANRVFPVER